MTKKRTRTIRVDRLARVEGEGGLRVRSRDGHVEDVQLEIYEPPRFFEGLLRGRAFTEAPDITARICGICPVAYQMSAVHALEAICGVRVDGPLRDLRRLLYCAEWIESHTLHVTLLHAPDFLGYDGGVEMARDHPGDVRRGLEIKKAGNELLAFLGGREIHPVNVRVGGFWSVPRRRDLRAFRPRLERTLELAREHVRWVAGFDYPPASADAEFVALRHPGEYAMNEGRIVSTGGLDIGAGEFETRFREEQVPWSTALHCALDGQRTYLVGPRARFVVNHDRLSPLVREAAAEAGLGTPRADAFRSIIVRGLEVLWSCEEALRLIDAWEEPDQPAVPVEPRAGEGCAATEAPRGLLWHRYRIDEEGTILDARIVPPTSQNQRRIEEDLLGVLEGGLERPDPEIALLCERAIRNHDPCISCATHFLRLEVDRG